MLLIIERQGIQKGLQQGILQRSREVLVEVLKARFQRVPETLLANIETLEDVSRLSTLLREAAVVDSLASFAQRLPQPLATPTVTRIGKLRPRR